MSVCERRVAAMDATCTYKDVESRPPLVNKGAAAPDARALSHLSALSCDTIVLVADGAALAACSLPIFDVRESQRYKKVSQLALILKDGGRLSLG